MQERTRFPSVRAKVEIWERSSSRPRASTTPPLPACEEEEHIGTPPASSSAVDTDIDSTDRGNPPSLGRVVFPYVPTQQTFIARHKRCPIQVEEVFLTRPRVRLVRSTSPTFGACAILGACAFHDSPPCEAKTEAADILSGV